MLTAVRQRYKTGVAGKVLKGGPVPEMVFSATHNPLREATTIDVMRAGKVPERRRSSRVPLHWTVLLACGRAGQPFRTMTRDISRDGFYCVIDQPLAPGERIECNIVVPTHQPRDPDDVVYLRCYAQAVRVEQIAATRNYGIACRIETYRVIRGAISDVGSGK